jgi:hypothetical protein
VQASGPESGERRRGGNEARARGRLAMVAFLAHAPGLYLLARRTLEPTWMRMNVAAVGATLVAMAIAGVALRDRGLAGAGIAGTWIVGHTAWSAYLAWGVLRGRALRDRRARR